MTSTSAINHQRAAGGVERKVSLTENLLRYFLERILSGRTCVSPIHLDKALRFYVSQRNGDDTRLKRSLGIGSILHDWCSYQPTHVK